MHRMISKSTISISKRYVEVDLWKTVIWKFLYTHFDMIGSPTGVETKKSFESISGLRVKLTTIYKVTKKKITPRSKNA